MPYRRDIRFSRRQPCGAVRAFLGGVAATASLAFFGMAEAQTANRPPVAGAANTPAEITIRIVNGDVQCGPRRMQLPPRDTLALRVVNQAERPIWFVAPKFFEAANVIQSAGFTYDLTKGGFLAAPGSTVSVQLTTPPSGEYYFSCFERTDIPTPQSSGFLLVTSAAH